MTRFVTIGSCLTGMTAIILNDELGWRRLNNAYAARSDYVVDYFIDRAKLLPDRATVLAGAQWRPDMETDGQTMLDECYRDRVGHLDTPSEAPGLFANLEGEAIDVILLDNLHDTYSVLTGSLPGSPGHPFALPLSLSRFANERELCEGRFVYSDPLTPEESVRSWVRICEYLHQIQPQARIYFFCAHALEEFHSPERIDRADGFALRFADAVGHLPVRVFPPLSPPRAAMQDGDHYSFDLYRAIAGMLQTEELAGWHPNSGAALASRAAASVEPAPAAAAPGGGADPSPPASPATEAKPAEGDLAARLKVVCDEEALEKNRSVVSPYASLPSTSFWRRSVARLRPEEVDPVIGTSFRIAREDKVATCGSCFAQHISKTLQGEGFHYLVTEPAPLTPGADPENFGVFPARFGNIYTLRQLRQMFRRAEGGFAPDDAIWQRADGAFVDAFRPQIQRRGFASPEALLADRAAHLRAVSAMFRDCDIFIFTLGLTEGWMSSRGGSVFPLPPGAVGVDMAEGECRFVNFPVDEMIADFREFITLLRGVNPDVRMILTVSPVPLIATYEPRHVLVSNTYSKSALRVVADVIAGETPGVDYFPSYEIITAIHNKSRFYEEDLREITPEGVASVMNIFKRHYIA